MIYSQLSIMIDQGIIGRTKMYNLVPRTSSVVDRKEAFGTRLHQRKCTQVWKKRAAITVEERIFSIFC